MFYVYSIKLEGQDNSSVEILGNVVQRSLQLLDMESKEETKFIKFGATIYGTDQVQPFLLYNDGPDLINYVVVLEEGGEGQEVVSNFTRNKDIVLIMVVATQTSKNSQKISRNPQKISENFRKFLKILRKLSFFI